MTAARRHITVVERWILMDELTKTMAGRFRHRLDRSSRSLVWLTAMKVEAKKGRGACWRPSGQGQGHNTSAYANL
ncbi:hypothetical protein MHYP_G00336300 [Metynnis hypsauchen]